MACRRSDCKEADQHRDACCWGSCCTFEHACQHCCKAENLVDFEKSRQAKRFINICGRKVHSGTRAGLHCTALMHLNHQKRTVTRTGVQILAGGYLNPMRAQCCTCCRKLASHLPCSGAAARPNKRPSTP